MVKDEQVRRMLRLMKEKPELSFSCHAAQSGMSEPTARKYVRLGGVAQYDAPSAYVADAEG